MLCVITLASDLIQQIARAESVGVVSNNHQVRFALVKSRGDDAVEFSHLIFQITPCLRIQSLVNMQNHIVDMHHLLLSVLV